MELEKIMGLYLSDTSSYNLKLVFAKGFLIFIDEEDFVVFNEGYESGAASMSRRVLPRNMTRRACACLIVDALLLGKRGDVFDESSFY